jgi:hypothetical protein
VPQTVVPPGWPPDLPPAISEEFADKVGDWLLERGPLGLRERKVWHRQPRALALVVDTHQGHVLAGLRESYASARRELSDLLASDELDRVLLALEAAGAEAAESARQVTLVIEALSGKRWRRRL